MQTLLNDLERPDLIEAAMGPPGIGQVSVKAFLTDTFARQPLSYWIDWFEGRNVCFAPVLNLHEAWHQPQVAAREMLIRDEGGNYFIGNPIKYKDEPGQLNLRLPELDGDGADIRDEMARKRSG